MSTITAAEEPFTGRRKGSLAKTFDEIRVIVWRNLSHIPGFRSGWRTSP